MDRRINEMKKIIIILCVLIMGTILFSIFHKKERIQYGDNIDSVQAEFPEIGGIESCYYKTEIIGSPFLDFIGPTNYHFTAVIIVNSDEMEKIAENYPEEKKDKLLIEQRLIDDTGIEDTMVWTFNQEFRSKVLGWSYVGEVYYLEEENAIYISVENL